MPDHVPEYTVLAVVAVVATVVLERRTGVHLFRRAQFWVAMAIVFAFQVLVDGWLTKLSAPIVLYAPEHHLGLRFPWDIPVEDYLFGFAMVASTIVLWERGKRRRAEAAGVADPTDRTTDASADALPDARPDERADQPTAVTPEEDPWLQR